MPLSANGLFYAVMCRAYVMHVYLKKHTQKLGVKLKKLRKLDKQVCFKKPV